MEKKNYIVAIDFGSNKVAAAAASKDPDGRLNIIDLISKPMEGMERGEVTNIEQVTAAARDALGQLEENLGIQVKDAYAGISGENIRCGSSTYHVFVGGQDGEIGDDDVVKLHEGMNTVQPTEGYVILDRIPQKYMIDMREETMKPVGRFGRRLEATFNFILGNRNSVDRLNKAMNRLQIQTDGVFTTAQASAAATLTDEEKELGVAVIDIGAGCTDICIWHGNIMRYVGVLPIGSNAINEDLRKIPIRDKVVEKLKVEYGYATVEALSEEQAALNIELPGGARRDNKKISFKALTQIIEARMLDIVEHIMGEIKDAGYAEKLGSGIVLTGGGANMPGIDLLFREQTKFDVRIAGADPSLVNDASAVIAADIANTSVIGLLMLGVENSRVSATANPLRKRGEQEKPSGPRVVLDDEEDDRPYRGGKAAPRDYDEPKHSRDNASDKDDDTEEDNRSEPRRSWFSGLLKGAGNSSPKDKQEKKKRRKVNIIDIFDVVEDVGGEDEDPKID